MAPVRLLGGGQHDDPLDARGQRLSFKELLDQLSDEELAEMLRSRDELKEAQATTPTTPNKPASKNLAPRFDRRAVLCGVLLASSVPQIFLIRSVGYARSTASRAIITTSTGGIWRRSA